MFINNLKNFIKIIINYKIAICFLFVFILLFYQNIIMNKFPEVIKDKQRIIDNIILEKENIILQNQYLLKEINKYNDDSILIESQARYKYNFIKPEEVYYQINKISN